MIGWTRRLGLVVATLAVIALTGCAELREAAAGESRAAGDLDGDWPHYAGDAGAMGYSPLHDIDRDNVDRLELAWTWDTGEEPPYEEDR